MRLYVRKDTKAYGNDKCLKSIYGRMVSLKNIVCKLKTDRQKEFIKGVAQGHQKTLSLFSEGNRPERVVKLIKRRIQYVLDDDSPSVRDKGFAVGLHKCIALINIHKETKDDKITTKG